ncbi:hypothetical protein EJ04DRAFT_75662 [Polyplosphaeria fusca]|uniref:Uncharacterized protein n=1 Tax=Polyplosphaeria fusca TaxID=682080 RepID=A0A9P4QMY7_9PLEO|nr:hypothetical protein EJ04DRAFT_75662 [Polyplosphaeria fusca]
MHPLTHSLIPCPSRLRCANFSAARRGTASPHPTWSAQPRPRYPNASSALKTSHVRCRRMACFAGPYCRLVRPISLSRGRGREID